ncbi:MAG TPA: sigma-70 family RNA polymerase sigma factor [Jiangellaceae bacterium]
MRRPARQGRHASTEQNDLRDDDLRDAYRAHGPELYRFARRALRDDDAARDTVQETFLRAWRSADRYDPAIGSLRVWLFAIARNLVVDEVRRKAARPVVPVPDESLVRLAPVADGQEDAAVTGWLVEEALMRISPEHRTALVETYLRNRPYAEVAAQHQVPVGTLRSRVFYGLKALRLAMQEMGVEP